jgi:hypothetical protein
MRCWKRHRIATDSSVEKRLEIEASSGVALTFSVRQRTLRKVQSHPERMRDGVEIRLAWNRPVIGAPLSPDHSGFCFGRARE